MMLPADRWHAPGGGTLFIRCGEDRPIRRATTCGYYTGKGSSIGEGGGWWEGEVDDGDDQCDTGASLFDGLFD